MLIYLSLLFAVVGLVIYFWSEKPKVVEVGRLTFACGLLAFLIKTAEPMVNVIGGR